MPLEINNLDETTYFQEVKSLANDKIEVEVGDSKQVDFKPQFKVMRWDNEVNFSMRAEEHPDAVVEVVDDKIKYITPEYEVHQYDKPDASDEGGFEFEWVLNTPPATNVLTATIQTKQLDFFYQSELTQEEKDRGTSQPDNVIGSYAVYHKAPPLNIVGGKEYKVGKAFHIYRPHVKDAKGNETWAELNIDVDNGLLTVTIPQEFLDTAVYPVVVDPTFGYTSAGATTFSIAHSFFGDGRFGGTYTGAAGTVDSLHAYFKDGATNVKGFLNSKDTGGTNSHNQVVGPITLAKASMTLNAFNTFTAASQSISAIDYLINFLGDGPNTGGSGNCTIAVDAAAGASQYDFTGDASYASPESPWTPADSTTGTFKGSVYVTYTSNTTTTQTITGTARVQVTGTQTITGKANIAGAAPVSPLSISLRRNF